MLNLPAEIINGYPRDLFDFFAFAQNVASEKNLNVDCPKTFESDKVPTTSVRCLFVSQPKVAQ